MAQIQKKNHTMLVEEANAIGWEGKNPTQFIEGSSVLHLLSHAATQDAPKVLRERSIKEALLNLNDLKTILDTHAEKRAQDLLLDHRRVREAADARGKYSVQPILPPDVIGVYVILPQVE